MEVPSQAGDVAPVGCMRGPWSTGHRL